MPFTLIHVTRLTGNEKDVRVFKVRTKKWEQTQSLRSVPDIISILDRSLASKLKTSQQVSVICCESWMLWRKHLKRSAGDGCLLLLLKSISRLTLPSCSDGYVHVCVSRVHKRRPAHTHTQTDRWKHTHRACAHEADQCEVGRVDAGIEGVWVALAEKCPLLLSSFVSRWLINLWMVPWPLLRAITYCIWRKWEERGSHKLKLDLWTNSVTSGTSPRLKHPITRNCLYRHV